MRDVSIAEAPDLFAWGDECGRPGPLPRPRKRRRRLVVSFSGGRTSALMTYLLLKNLDASEWEILVIFANTGQEHEQTLRFVQLCETVLGFPVIWVEAVTDPRMGKGVRFRRVTFDTASRDGAPFEAFIAKHGIPNVRWPACTRELKARPIRAYLRSIGWRHLTYDTAIGIRADEADRINPDHVAQRIIYPLVDLGIRKEQVVQFWREQAFDLRIPEHLGNCVWCWKKSLRKHLTLAKFHRPVFDFPQRMEVLYPFSGNGKTGEPRRFFRENRTVEDLLARSREPFEPFVDGNHRYDEELDVGVGCGETCEIGADEVAA